MLQLVLGRSGFGKTHWIHDQVAAWAQGEGGPLYLLVPEQFSFESERALLRRLSPAAANRVQVITFSRLAETLCPPKGGQRVDDTVRTLLMSEALSACRDQLDLYRAHTADPDYIGCLLSLLTECKQNAISPAMLEQTASLLPDNALKHKTQELGLILAAYDALMGQAWTDPLDDLSCLAEHLKEHPLPTGTCVAVDSFNGFTGQELAVLRLLIRQAKQVTVALCTDTLEVEEDSGDPLSLVSRTACRLVDMARDDHVPVAAPVHLRQRRRTDSPALCRVEAGLFGAGTPSLEGDSGDVTLLACDDIYGECEAVARLIRRQLREGGGRCRDIAIVVRRMEDYRGVLDAALDKQGIAYYLDSRRDVMTDSLFSLVTGAMQVAAGDWNTELLLRIAKTGLTGFSSHSVALLENYAYTWRLTGKGWRREWTDHPDGLSVQADEASFGRLAYLNRLRHRLTAPLERLYHAFHRAPALNGEEFARAVWRYLTDVRAGRMLQMQVAQMQRTGEPGEGERMARLWPLLVDLLDTFARTFRERPLPCGRLTELFGLVLSMTDLGEIPQTLDGVQIGSADRMRFASPDTVFVLGANEGVFPAYPGEGNLWSTADRQRLIAAGLPLSDTGDDAVLQERLFAYQALSAPCGRLCISWVRGNTAGETLLPSLIVDNIGRLLPGCRRMDTAKGKDEVESEQDAFEQVARGWNRPDAQISSLKEALASRPGMTGRLAMLARAARQEPIRFEDSKAAARFFGKDMRLSPSRVEQYHLCRFAYFCRYGLRARPRKPADLDAAEFGTLAHYVMERLLPGYTQRGFENVQRQEVAADTQRVVGEYVDEYMGGLQGKPHRFAYLLERLKATCRRLLWQVVLELRQSKFVPTDFELEIGSLSPEGNDRVEPIVLTLPDGARIRVQGKVDRVDVYRQGGTAYVRIVDYKTGAKQFRLSDVVEGINLQMLIYMMSIWQNGEKRYGPVKPAGLLYLPARLPVLRVDRHASGEELEREGIRALRMNGLLLDHSDIVRAMEADAAGLFIPAGLTQKEEWRRGSSVASLEQFGQLKRRMEKLLCDMARTLREGDIAALPACGAADACAYCDYKAVCGFETGQPVRYIAQQDAAEVWKELAQQEEAHE